MAEQSTEPVKVDFDELRKKYLDAKSEGHRILGRLQQPKDKVFPFSVQRGTQSLPLRFRRWNYGETLLITQLPFFPKILGDQKLTDEEEDIFTTVKMELVESACLDKPRWKELMLENPKILEQAYAVVSYISGLDSKFIKELNEFMDSDLGRKYGDVWIGLLGKVPSEIAELPFMDVMAVNTWASKWLGVR